MTLDRTSLLAALARPPVKVEIPELDNTVYLREMSVRERSEFNKKLFGGEEKDKTIPVQTWALALVAATVCDEHGTLLFNGADQEALWDASELKIGALAKQAAKINGLDQTAVESAEKNSESTTMTTSVSSSPKPSG